MSSPAYPTATTRLSASAATASRVARNSEWRSRGRFLRNPPILLLDEATSSLDSETERAVQEALDQLSAGRTTTAIAHRLSTVRNADQIVVLDGGRIAERGTHGSLMALSGRYGELVGRDLDEAPVLIG